MSSKLSCLRVFIASPGGLEAERKAFRNQLDEFNETDAIEREVFFRATGWEDTLGGVGRPQMLINEDVQRADYLILVLWDRWGSTPSNGASGYTSGTEEEYHIALECHAAGTLRNLLVLFKAVDLKQLNDPGAQLQKVLEFRRELEQSKAHLFQTFDSLESFSKIIRRHLSQWLRDEEKGGISEKILPAPLLQIESQNLNDKIPTVLPDSVRNSIKKAWELADSGRLTDAEIEFARNIVGRNEPQPMIEFGRFLYRIGRVDQAISMLDAAVKAADEQNEYMALSDAYRNIGNALCTRGDLENAEKMYRSALTIDEKLKRDEEIAKDYGNIGNVLCARSNYDEAEKMHRQAIKICEKIGHEDSMAIHFGNLGNIFRAHGNFVGAEEMHRKALEIDQKNEYQEGIARHYGNIGIILHARDDLDGAENMYRKALEIDEHLGHLQGIASHYGNLGIVLNTRGDLDGAERMFRQALEIDERLGRLEGIANHYGNLGNVFLARGNVSGAEEMFLRSLDLDQRLGRLEGIANGYGSLGVLYETKADFEAAEQMYLKALEIDLQLRRLESVSNHLFNLGEVFFKKGDLEKAKENYRKSLDAAEKIGSQPLREAAQTRIDMLDMDAIKTN